jgi:predicted phage terminase large subunit-like protein
LAWASQYQGTPRPPEGSIFKRAWFPIVDSAPADAQRVRYWDLAGTQDGGAYTAGVLMAKSKDKLFYVEDVVRGQWSAAQRDAVILQMAQLDTQRHRGVRTWFEQEPGSGGKEQAAQQVKMLAGFTAHAERVTGDKVTRAMPLAAQAEAGNVRLVRGAWNGGFLEELTSFPNGRFKDQTDGASGAFNKLALTPAPQQGFAPRVMPSRGAGPLVVDHSYGLGGRTAVAGQPNRFV